MSQTFDVVSVGSGHHGLVAAAYMAKAGKSVLVLERHDCAGGGCITKELIPGHYYDEHATVHQVILSNPLLKNDELALKSRFGLEYIYPEAHDAGHGDQVRQGACRVKLYNPDGSELMTITAIERDGKSLVIKGDIFGSMPINTLLRPNEARAGLKLMSIRKLLFLISMLFR